MSKSFFGILISAAVAGFIAGGAVALYGMASGTPGALQLSPQQAALASTLLGAIAMAVAILVVRWTPDNKTMPIEDAMLSVMGGIAAIAMAAASFWLMTLASSVTQLWLVPAVASAAVASFVGFLPIAIGVMAISDWVPDQATAK